MARTAYLDGYSFGAVNSSTKKQVMNFTCSWDYNSADDHVRIGFITGPENPPAAGNGIYWYDTASGKSPGYWRDGTNYSSGGPETIAYDGGAVGSLQRGYPLDCDKTLYVNARVVYWADYDETTANSRTSSTSSYKTYAIEAEATQYASSAVAETTATISSGNWYVNTNESTGYAYLEYKKSSDSTWTQAGSATGSVSGYGVQSNFDRNLTGLTPATTYQYRVQIVRTTANATTYTSGTGTFTTLNTTPSVTTSAATSVTSDSATLNGSVDPNTTDVAPGFDLGTSSGNYNVLNMDTISGQGHFDGPGSTCASLGHTSSADAVSMTKAVTGLSPSTTYYARAVVIKNHGTGDRVVYAGNEISFTTSAPPAVPEVATAAATSVGGTSATLNGTVHPHGISTTYDFQYGTVSGMYSADTADQGPSSANAQFAFSQALTGLAYSTTYYYRARGLYSGNYIYGSESSFTTGVDPGVVLAAEAAAEEHVRTIEFDAQTGQEKIFTFVLFAPGNHETFYTGDAPTSSDLFLFKDGVATSWSVGGGASVQRVGTYLYVMTVAATELTSALVDIVIQDASATKAFRSLHLQIHTKRDLGQVDIDSTTFASDANAVNLTAHGTGYSLYAADDIVTAETLTILSNLAVGSNLTIGGDLDIAGSIVADGVTVGGDVTIGGDLTADVISAATIQGPLTSMTLGAGTVSAAAAYVVTLDAGASATNGAYVGSVLGITSGTGEGQYRIIEAYDGTNRQATINRSWSVVPNATSKYTIWPPTDMWLAGPSEELTVVPPDLSFYGPTILALFERFFYPREQRETPNAAALTFKMFKADGTTPVCSATVADAGGENATQTIAKMS